jgi:hypothetical protein
VRASPPLPRELPRPVARAPARVRAVAALRRRPWLAACSPRQVQGKDRDKVARVAEALGLSDFIPRSYIEQVSGGALRRAARARWRRRFDGRAPAAGRGWGVSGALLSRCIWPQGPAVSRHPPPTCDAWRPQPPHAQHRCSSASWCRTLRRCLTTSRSASLFQHQLLMISTAAAHPGALLGCRTRAAHAARAAPAAAAAGAAAGVCMAGAGCLSCRFVCGNVQAAACAFVAA